MPSRDSAILQRTRVCTALAPSALICGIARDSERTALADSVGEAMSNPRTIKGDGAGEGFRGARNAFAASPVVITNAVINRISILVVTSTDAEESARYRRKRRHLLLQRH